MIQWYHVLRTRADIDELLKEDVAVTEDASTNETPAPSQEATPATAEEVAEATPKKGRKKKDADTTNENNEVAEKPKKPRATKKKEE